MKTSKIFLLLAASAMPAYAQTGAPDPYQRDEDISATQVSVGVTALSTGLFAYNYTVTAPALNKGVVSTLRLDVACPEVQNRNGLPPQDIGPGFKGDSSTDGRHSALNISADYGAASTYGIDVINQANWGLGLIPTETTAGLRLVSKYPPIARRYKLDPDMDTGAPWDYSNVEPNDPNLPWIDDFTVMGMTQGPGCPGDEPPPPPEPTRFPGTVKPEESESVNALLSYSAPLADRLHVGSAVGQLAMTIHYANDIDPKSFRVEPQNDKLRKLFNPRKGASETVQLPLNAAKTKFILSVQREFTPPGQSASPNEPGSGKGRLQKDIDVFEVRVDTQAPAGKKNAK